jgi:iron complex outermembrane receptor protein
MKSSQIKLMTALAALTVAIPPISANAAGLEEVIVTAQKRAESLQDSALAIDAISADQLERSGIESGLDLGKLSPSLGIAAGGGPLAAIFMRGVGSFTVNPLLDSAVAQNYDGVYLGRSSAASGQTFFDMERVEVLKGPQGTLYGRNATGGVVNYLPNKPSLEGDSGYIQAEIGDYSKIALQGATNIVTSDTTAVRLAASIQERDGYSDDGTNDSESASIRAQVLFEPSDALSVRIAADYTDVGGIGNNGSLSGQYGANPFGPATAFTPSGLGEDSGGASAGANAIRTGVLAAPAFAFLPPIDPNELFQDFQYTGLMSEINYDLESGTLTVIPAYRKAEQDYSFIGPGFSPATTLEESDQFSLEARFATNLDGPVNGVVGAYYFDEEIDLMANFNQTYVLPIQENTSGTESVAIFADGTFDVSDTFRVNAGVRYTKDEKFVEGVSNTVISFCGGPPGFPDPNFTFATPGGTPLANGFNPNRTSFSLGCAFGGIPTPPITNSGEEIIASYVASGHLLPGSTFSDGFWPIFNPAAPGAPIAALINISPDLITSELSYSETTYRLGVEYDFGEDNLFYAGFQRGYRAGGVDVSLISPTYEPEYIDSFTVGIKTRAFDNTVQFNAEAFIWDYTDQQVSYLATVNGAPDFPTANANSTIQGLDLDVIWAVSDSTTLRAKAQFLDATYDELDLFSDPGTGRFGCPTSGLNASGFETFDCTGTTLLFSPEVSFDLGIEHIISLDNYEVGLFADISYRDEQATDFSFLPKTISDSYTTLDLAASVAPLDGNWLLTAYVRNATDERYVTSSSIGTPGLLYQIYNAPTTYGLRVRYDF